MFTITHPRPELGRQKFIGVEFRDGVATVETLHPERKLALEQHGFAVVESQLLEDLSKAELLEIAWFEQITIPAKATKAQIIAALAAADLPVLE